LSGQVQKIETHGVSVVGVIVVVRTVAVHIPEIVGAGSIRRTQPPVGRAPKIYKA